MGPNMQARSKSTVVMIDSVDSEKAPRIVNIGDMNTSGHENSVTTICVLLLWSYVHVK